MEFPSDIGGLLPTTSWNHLEPIITQFWLRLALELDERRYLSRRPHPRRQNKIKNKWNNKIKSNPGPGQGWEKSLRESIRRNRVFFPADSVWCSLDLLLSSIFGSRSLILAGIRFLWYVSSFLIYFFIYSRTSESGSLILTVRSFLSSPWYIPHVVRVFRSWVTI